ncbi:MAG TPA: Na+/H+ antiporter NhaA [Chiayiivirga sp.]|nr:Na+/H+ antiporter NhaA [Chiayiivirga sp.]
MTPANALGRVIDLLRGPAGGGMLLVLCATAAMLIANSPWREAYFALLGYPLGLGSGASRLDLPVLLWINDALMALFFLLVALEIKREMVVGQLRTRAQLMLPLVCAISGMAVPAAIYAGFNFGDIEAIHGWAIPSATDIAFALGILALLGSRVPLGLKVLLSAIAVLDDLGAIVVIALFYTDHLQVALLLAALGVLVLMYLLNLFGLARTWLLLVLGAVLWVLVFKSGVHATLAGVATGLMIPLHDRRDPGRAPLERLERQLHPWVTWVILPLFAFANAGVDLAGVTLEMGFHAVPLGIAMGLVVGKPIGIGGAAWLARRAGLASWPAGVRGDAMLGMAMLCGIGFTMSLFIGSLSFDPGSEAAHIHRLGILGGSTIAAIIGSLWLRRCLRPVEPA